jgi:hypothetical protein
MKTGQNSAVQGCRVLIIEDDFSSQATARKSSKMKAPGLLVLPPRSRRRSRSWGAKRRTPPFSM